MCEKETSFLSELVSTPKFNTKLSLHNFFQPPDVAKELTGGCKGFATEFMQWAEELVVGGTEKDNQTLKR